MDGPYFYLSGCWLTWMLHIFSLVSRKMNIPASSPAVEPPFCAFDWTPQHARGSPGVPNSCAISAHVATFARGMLPKHKEGFLSPKDRLRDLFLGDQALENLQEHATA